MIDYVLMILLVALGAAFMVLLIKKWGLAEWMQVHGDKYIAQLFSCDLCMSFWSAVLMCLCLCIVTDCGLCMAIPAFSTPITRLLV